MARRLTVASCGSVSLLAAFAAVLLIGCQLESGEALPLGSRSADSRSVDGQRVPAPQNNYPGLLRDLRLGYEGFKQKVTDSHPDETLLGSSRLAGDLKGPLRCQALSEMIQFLLQVVLPDAENSRQDLRSQFSTLGDRITGLRQQLRRDPTVFPCESRSDGVSDLRSAYTRLGSTGAEKVLSEFDIFINYIEAYVTSV
ncbi:Interleukin-10 [Eptesicus fuscus gammaherpesvirus]|uniref:Viral interleukin-10 homolog n=1 Tax=vespertilionid gammaherpesvirus 3 TaxID=2846598 RepID=A0A2D1AF31_9GAMA|nr:Interleukin-10 [Eptesicus fuscus gammaherpesvirus]ATA58302.1 Interleukin-10 [Eptesicus fuscus gammaherpesvirus]WAH70925.1 interleukin 10 precursor [Eptesicus fuscus gammaherpesvirus]